MRDLPTIPLRWWWNDWESELVFSGCCGLVDNHLVKRVVGTQGLL